MRPGKDQYYLNITKEVAQRATCFRLRVGAIIVRDDQIIATGYNGAPRKTKDCLERGFCLREKLEIPHGRNYEICRSCHAEQNAIINSARAGVSLLNGDMYLCATDSEEKVIKILPCYICKKMIINAGLKRIICSVSANEHKIFNIQDWVKDWQEKDVLDDEYQYGK